MSSLTKKIANAFGLKSSSNAFITKAVRILELQYGHFQSVQDQRAIGKDGLAIPWFTYPAIEYLSQLNLAEKTMLEWGSGNSSVFFGARVKKMYSVEHNQEWFAQVKGKAIKGHEIIHAPEAEYAQAATRFQCKFDIILIDGVEREACSEQAVKLIGDDGLIILDNSDRHPDISKRLRDANFIQADFHGFGPINNYTWTTSVFFTRKFNFQPIDRQPVIPIGGGF
jgi:hypothetical protein